MAEALVVVCDTCGKPASDTVSIRTGGKGFQKDLCAKHVKELLTNARPAKRGRPKTSTKSRKRRS